MNGDITKLEENNAPMVSLPQSSIQQYGNKNIAISGSATINQTINKNIIINENKQENKINKITAIKNFSLEYFQLIISDALNINNKSACYVNKEDALLKKYVPSELYKVCSMLTPDGIETLKTFPAIICNKCTFPYGKSNDSEKAIYAYLTNISKLEHNIKIEFEPIDTFPQKILAMPSIARDFSVNIDCMESDLNITGWYIKKANLFNHEFIKEGNIDPGQIPWRCRHE